MGIEKGFRTTLSKQEIHNSLLDMYVENGPVMIWQNHNGNRKILKAKIESINVELSLIMLIPDESKNTTDFKNIDSALTLYFIGESKNIVFKLDQIKMISSKSIGVAIPEEIKLMEKRSESRCAYESSYDPVKVEIYAGGKTKNSVSPTTVELVDISLSGIGFYLQNKLTRNFYEKDQIRLSSIGKYRFQRPIYGSIVYIVDGKRKYTHRRVGIRFAEKLSEDILNAIIKSNK